MNLTKWENIVKAANKSNLDINKLKIDYEDKANQLFEEDLDLARKSGVRGFPTLIFYNKELNQTIVYGARPYVEFEKAIKKAYPNAVKKTYNKDVEYLIKYFGSLTAKELSVLADITMNDAEEQLTDLRSRGVVDVITSKNGYLWVIK